MLAFFAAVFMICAGTLMYEVVLTRLLSAVSWYYLAFVSISMAMFGMTVGALAVQLRPDLFDEKRVPCRMAQASFALAVSAPLALLTMLAVPIDLSYALETLYSFLLFSAIISVPFFFSGVAVCLSLTKTAFPIGRVYFADLLGAASGCFASVALMKLMDAPSGIFAISALLFFGSASYAKYAGDLRGHRRSCVFAAAMLVVTGLNASTLHGIQPIWSKGKIDRREHLLAEIWNPISKVRAVQPELTDAFLWGPSPRVPRTRVEQIWLDIDNDAATPITRYQGDLATLDFLRYDVTSIGAKLRAGGTAAIIGVGGGRDVLNCALNEFHRIVGIEVNSTIVDLTKKQLEWFSGFDKIPGFELHTDEGRSYLTRTDESFDLIQASLVDTWAATTAGAMTLTENSLYTVDAWRVFYRHLKLGGLIAFSRWNYGAKAAQIVRLFSVGWGTLIAEGVTNPGGHIALLSSGRIATLLLSNRPFSEKDISMLRQIADTMDFELLFLPGQETLLPELKTITAARTFRDLARLRDVGLYDFSPVFDSSPYFFNAVRLHSVAPLFLERARDPNLHAMLFVFCFMLAAIMLVVLTILWPVKHWASGHAAARQAPLGGIAYFIAIGLGFMLIEIAMMQQLSIFLGHPIYSLVVVLVGLILSTGIGSLVSDKLGLSSSLVCRLPAFAVTLLIVLYSIAVLPVIHHFVPAVLWQRVALSLALVTPCGFLMGFCFPVGIRWMKVLRQEENLPWMWALNGAAATLGSFVAIVISMETTITICAVTGASCYLLAALALPRPATAKEVGPAVYAVAELPPIHVSVFKGLYETKRKDLSSFRSESSKPGVRSV